MLYDDTLSEIRLYFHIFQASHAIHWEIEVRVHATDIVFCEYDCEVSNSDKWTRKIFDCCLSWHQKDQIRRFLEARKWQGVLYAFSCSTISPPTLDCGERLRKKRILCSPDVPHFLKKLPSNKIALWWCVTAIGWNCTFKLSKNNI